MDATNGGASERALVDKATVLAEALTGVRRLEGKTVVVKYGGAAMKAADLRDATMQDVALMSYLGIHVVLVHGGGPTISETMQQVGKKPSFIDGLRVTDAETMDIVQMALVGRVNRDIVTALTAQGARAVGLSGHDAGLLRATRRVHRDSRTGEAVDLGFVGDVESVDVAVLDALRTGGFVPVIAPVGVGSDRRSYNINADSAAGAIAAALGAHELVLLTDVEGLRADATDPTSTVRTLRADDARRWVASGRTSGGMIPKLEACLTALAAGAARARIADGRVAHVLLQELFTEEPLGTTVVA